MQRLLILLGMFVLLSGLAWWSLHQEQRNTTAVIGYGEVLQGLSTQTDTLTSLVVTDSRGELVRVDKHEAGWHVHFPETDRYFPANVDDIAALINTLAKARIVERKTQVPANYPRLGVEDITTADASSRLLSLSSDSQQWQLLVGHAASTGDGQFVRYPEQAQSYLIDSTLQLPQTKSEWLRSQVIEWEVNELTEVVFTQSADTISLQQDDENQWQLPSLAADEQLRYPNVLSQTLRSLLRFRFTDVEPFEAGEWESRQPVVTVTLHHSQGETVQAQLYETTEGDEYRLHLSSSEADRWFSTWLFHLDAFSAKAWWVTRDTLVETVEANTDTLNDVETPTAW